MGIKFLSLQTIPWCFHVMGNHMTCIHNLPHPDPPLHTVKVIKSDGQVQIFDRPIAASQLMLEFPKHLICHSDSFFIGQKIKALSESDQLQPGHKYFLLPKPFFQTVLSFVTIASFAASSSSSSASTSTTSTCATSWTTTTTTNNSNDNNSYNYNFKSASLVKKAASCRPFDIHRTPSGTLQIRVSDEFIAKLMEEGRLNNDQQAAVEGKKDIIQSTIISNATANKGRVCTTPELEKDYTRLVGWKRSKDWRPKLETIKEKKEKKEKKLVAGSFGMKSSRKGQSQTQLDGTVTRKSPNPNQKQTGINISQQQLNFENVVRGNTKDKENGKSKSNARAKAKAKTKVEGL